MWRRFIQRESFYSTFAVKFHFHMSGLETTASLVLSTACEVFLEQNCMSERNSKQTETIICSSIINLFQYVHLLSSKQWILNKTTLNMMYDPILNPHRASIWLSWTASCQFSPDVSTFSDNHYSFLFFQQDDLWVKNNMYMTVHYTSHSWNWVSDWIINWTNTTAANQRKFSEIYWTVRTPAERVVAFKLSHFISVQIYIQTRCISHIHIQYWGNYWILGLWEKKNVYCVLFNVCNFCLRHLFLHTRFLHSSPHRVWFLLQIYDYNYKTELQ